MAYIFQKRLEAKTIGMITQLHGFPCPKRKDAQEWDTEISILIMCLIIQKSIEITISDIFEDKKVADTKNQKSKQAVTQNAKTKKKKHLLLMNYIQRKLGT